MLTRIQFLDGTVVINVLQPSAPTLVVPNDRPRSCWRAPTSSTASSISGSASITFCCVGLLLIVGDRWTLVKTITSFTVAHSITLAIATLGFAHAPVEPLNAAIALASCSWARNRAQLARRDQPDQTAPVAGGVHLRAAARLRLRRRAQRCRPAARRSALALLTFNIGVEIGQAAFVLLVVLLERSFRQLEIRWPTWLAGMPGYLIGSAGAFWTFQRTADRWGAAIEVCCETGCVTVAP